MYFGARHNQTSWGRVWGFFAILWIALSQASALELQTNIGSHESTQTLTAAGAITCGTAARYRTVPVAGSGGAVTMTSNPQVLAGTSPGQLCDVQGTSNTNTVTIVEGNGVDLMQGGTVVLDATRTLQLEWTGSIWRQRAPVSGEQGPQGPPGAPGSGSGLSHINVITHGITSGDNTDDDTLAINATIDAANALASNGGNVPTVYIPCGDYHIKTTIVGKRPRIRGESEALCVVIYWDGTAGVTAMTQTVQQTWGGIENIRFRSGTAKPGIWLDTSAVTIDKHWIVRNTQFEGSSGDAIYLGGGYINLHWKDIRWDSIGGYAIHAKMQAGAFAQNFHLYDYTVDNRTQTTSEGIFQWDNSTAVSANLGAITIGHGRIELHSALVGQQAIFNIIPSAGGGTGVLQLHFEGLSYQDIVGHVGDTLVKVQDASARVVGMMVTNHVLSGLDALTANILHCDSVPDDFKAFPASGSVRDYSCSRGLLQVAYGAFSIRAPTSESEAHVGFKMFQGAEVVERLKIRRDGSIHLSNGTNAADVALSRSAAGVMALGTGHSFRPGTTTFGALGSPANGATTYCSDCTKATPCASGGTGAIAKRINGQWDCD